RRTDAALRLPAVRKCKPTEETDMTTTDATTDPGRSATARGISPSSSASDRILAGITVPDTPAIALALERARSDSEPYLFNHAVRSWLFATRIAQLKSIAHDAEV